MGLLQRPPLLLAIVLGLAVAVRLGAAVLVEQRLAPHPDQLCLIPGDAEGYWMLAEKIRAGEDYAIYQPPRAVLRMPGFPLLIAALQSLGFNRAAIRLTLAVIGGLGCGLIFLLGKELRMPTAGLIATALIAVAPAQIIFSVLLLSETTFAVTIVLSLWLLVRCWQHPAGITRAVLAGAGIALATYFRPTWIIVAPFTVAVLLLHPRVPFSTRLRSIAWVTVGCVALMSPWMIRNAAITGHFVPTTLWMGPSLYDGWNPTATGDSEMTFFDQDNLLGQMSEYEMDREYRRRAVTWALAHPQRVVELAGVKFLRYWNIVPNAAQFREPLPMLVMGGWFAVVIAAALSGTWVMRHAPLTLLVAWGPILLFCAVHLIFVGSVRYRLPAEWPFCLLAAAGVLSIWNRRHEAVSGPAEGLPPCERSSAD